MSAEGNKRWLATVNYRSDAVGVVAVDYDIEELDELADLIEAGPSWHTIDKITIRLQRTLGYEHMTLEQAENE